jgi:hypothetical protein
VQLSEELRNSVEVRVESVQRGGEQRGQSVQCFYSDAVTLPRAVWQARTLVCSVGRERHSGDMEAKPITAAHHNHTSRFVQEATYVMNAHVYRHSLSPCMQLLRARKTAIDNCQAPPLAMSAIIAAA